MFVISVLVCGFYHLSCGGSVELDVLVSHHRQLQATVASRAFHRKGTASDRAPQPVHLRAKPSGPLTTLTGCSPVESLAGLALGTRCSLSLGSSGKSKSRYGGSLVLTGSESQILMCASVIDSQVRKVSQAYFSISSEWMGRSSGEDMGPSVFGEGTTFGPE